MNPLQRAARLDPIDVGAQLAAARRDPTLARRVRDHRVELVSPGLKLGAVARQSQ